MPYDRELAVALEAAERAGGLILDHYAAWTPVADAPASISTATDLASQEAILEVITSTFPNDAFRAEEATPALDKLSKTGSRIWIIDPIDGTRGFAKKNGEFSVMIGFVLDGTACAGVVLEPAKERLTYATRGGGCWRRDRRQPPARVHVTAND